MHANLQCPPPRQACAWPASCPPKLGARLAREARAALYLECSALTRHGVQQLFHDAVDLVTSGRGGGNRRKKKKKMISKDKCFVL